MLKNTNEQLQIHKSEGSLVAFFDTVIFCTNVTYGGDQLTGGMPF